ncbi:uncharacterized protein LOC135825549 isoform X2 [Sycon ciliatum]|uniref:uncharacterized protein LOC135825549 isoform X2 n=1 Tax=Sycon ciliatum TaxID=27933 RepID=UPI0031F5F363
MNVLSRFIRHQVMDNPDQPPEGVTDVPPSPSNDEEPPSPGLQRSGKRRRRSSSITSSDDQEAIARRREQARVRKQRERSKETEEQADRRRLLNRRQTAATRSQETHEQTQERRDRNCRRAAEARSHETPEQADHRRSQSRMQVARARSLETQGDTEVRRSQNAQRVGAPPDENASATGPDPHEQPMATTRAAKHVSTMTAPELHHGKRSHHQQQQQQSSSNGTWTGPTEHTSERRNSGSSSSGSGGGASTAANGRGVRATDKQSSGGGLLSPDGQRRNEPVVRFKRKYAGQQLEVTCNGQRAILDVDNLPDAVGSMMHAKRQCVEYNGRMMTPTEFETATGYGSRKNWRSSVRMGNQSMKQILDSLCNEEFSFNVDSERKSAFSPASTSTQSQKHQRSSSVSTASSVKSPVAHSNGVTQSSAPCTPAQSTLATVLTSFSNDHLQRRVQTIAVPSNENPSASMSVSPTVAAIRGGSPHAYAPLPSSSALPSSRQSSPPSSRAPQQQQRSREGSNGTAPGKPAGRANGSLSPGQRDRHHGHNSKRSRFSKTGAAENGLPDLIPARSAQRTPSNDYFSPQESSAASSDKSSRWPGVDLKRSPPIRLEYSTDAREDGMSITVSAEPEDTDSNAQLYIMEPGPSHQIVTPVHMHSPPEALSSSSSPSLHEDMIVGRKFPAGHPHTWTCNQVALYLRSCNMAAAARACEADEINGRALLHLREEHMLNRFRIKLGTALNLVELIKQINLHFFPAASKNGC